MADPIEQERPASGPLSLAISTLIVGLLREYTGRGPTKARTTIRDNVVLVMLEQTLTKGERSLVAKGRADKVLEIRHEFQNAMREECSAKVAELTGRTVVAFLSANHIDPDLGAEIFLLDGPPRDSYHVAHVAAEAELRACPPPSIPRPRRSPEAREGPRQASSSRQRRTVERSAR